VRLSAVAIVIVMLVLSIVSALQVPEPTVCAPGEIVVASGQHLDAPAHLRACIEADRRTAAAGGDDSQWDEWYHEALDDPN
jgi:hypothetical protein